MKQQRIFKVLRSLFRVEMFSVATGSVYKKDK